jgi:hypothetical protein
MPGPSSSPRIRPAPQSRLLEAMRRTRAPVSAGKRGRGLLGLQDLQRQKRQYPCRCQRRIVSGFTSRAVSRQLRTSLESITKTPRSRGRKAGRFTLRNARISCWRSSAFSASSSIRDGARSTANPATRATGRVASRKTDLMACTVAVAAARRRRRKLDSTGCDLAEGRRSFKLVESGNLNDRGADETASQNTRDTTPTTMPIAPPPTATPS